MRWEYNHEQWRRYHDAGEIVTRDPPPFLWCCNKKNHKRITRIHANKFKLGLKTEKGYSDLGAAVLPVIALFC
jgi:hypothetical protein